MANPRLKRLLAGRQPYPWGLRLGLNKQTINRLVNLQIPPSSKFLSRICRVERANLSWLLEGLGAPFVVSHFADGDGAANHLEARLAEREWRIYLVRGGQRHCVVLAHPAQLADDRWSIDYTHIEVVAGAIGPAALNVLLESASGEVIYETDLRHAAFARLVEGDVGNDELLGWLQDAAAVDSLAPEDHADYLAGELPAAEREFMEDWRDLRESDRQIIANLLRRLADSD